MRRKLLIASAMACAVVLLPLAATSVLAQTSTTTPPPSYPLGEVPRVEGAWDVESEVISVSATEGYDTDQPDIGTVESGFWWALEATCDVGPCDVIFRSFGTSAPCLLTFDGVMWSGHLGGAYEAEGCEGIINESGVPPVDQPITFRVVEWLETGDGPVATSIEGTFTAVANMGYSSDANGQFQELRYITLVTSSFHATRVDPPVATTDPEESTTTSTTVVVPEEGGSASPGAGSGGGSEVSRSTISTSLRQPTQVSTDPAVIGTNLLLAIILVLLMPFPGELFNKTLEENYDRVKTWWGRFSPSFGAGESAGPGALIGVALAGGLLTGLLDPGFGLNLRSAAIFLGGLIAVAMIMALGVGLSAWLVRKESVGVRLSVTALPGALAVAVACVVLSRAIGYQPGYIYGVLAGLSVAGVVSRLAQGRAAALAAGSLGVVSLGAWLLWTALQPSLSAAPGFGTVVLDTLLAAVFVAGLEGMAFGLVPMRFLAGRQVLDWSRWAWTLLFGIGIFAVLHLLAHPGQGYGPTESAVPFITVVAMFVGFGVLSVGFWSWFRYRPAPQVREADAPAG